MIDLIDLKENLDIYKKGLSAKGCDIDLEDLLKKNISKNALQVELDELKGQRNTLSKEIGSLSSRGEDSNDLKKESEKIGLKIESLQKQFEQEKLEFESILLQIPNLPDTDVPFGNDESSNQEIFTKVFTQANNGLDHVEIGE